MSTAEITDIATRPQGTLSVAAAALTIQEIVAQKQLITQAVKELMQDGEHYGTIPGAKKKSLWKPGADLLCSLFQLDADYINEEVVHEPGYIYYRLKCVLKHIPSGRVVGAGLGSCNSREEKYRRAAPKKCPKCDKEAIKRSKYPDRDRPKDEPGWYCHDKAGGCGANYRYEDKAITEQDAGIADTSDLDNTILKMAAKRSRIDACLTVTGASDFFTQDVEDLSEKARRLFAIDVEAAPAAPPVAKEGSAPKAPAPPAATSAAETTSSQSIAQAGRTSVIRPGPTTTTKPPRANTVKHDGTFASHKQVAYLHMLKTKAGVTACKPEECGIEVEEEKKWGKTTKRIQRCTYHAQLAAFRDCDDKPITTSKDLSEDQISNLIDRYEAKLQKQETRAEEVPDLEAAFSQAEENARIRGELGPGSDG